LPIIITAVSLLILICIVLVIASAVFFNIGMVRRPVIDRTGDPNPKGHLAQFYPRMHEARKWFLANVHSVHTVTSFDGLKLYARYFKTDSPAVSGENRMIICFHGYRSSAPHDFGIVTQEYLSMGYNVLAVDQRAHGESEGKYIGYGVLERRDCLKWCEYAVSTFGSDVKIWLDGVSMGASTVMMASNLGLPDNVRGIIADCGFTSPREIMIHVLRRNYHLPPFPLINIVSAVTKRIAGFSFDEVSTVDVLKENKIPIIFLHGDADDFVPTEMTYRSHEAAAAKKHLVIVEGAGHGTSYMVDHDKCVGELTKFFAETA